ncbi:MAG: family 43 glycosylhydrolase [Candidatus Scatosoma sp.]
MASGSLVTENTKIKVTITGEEGKTKKLLLNGESTGISVTNSAKSVTGEFVAEGENMAFSLQSEELAYKQNPVSAVKNSGEPDQNILYDNGVYYRTLWSRNNSSDYSDKWYIASNSDLSAWSTDSKWTLTQAVDLKTVFGSRYKEGYAWAPDLIKFGGKYYIVGTVGLTDYTGKNCDGFYRTTVIFRADSPTGPYTLISKKNTAKETALNNGLITPVYGTDLGGITAAAWCSIDATIYAEGNTAYLVWSDEHTNYSSGTGNYYYAKLSSDLSCLAEKPKLLFKPSSWVSAHKTTDSVWIHKAENGELLALYTTFDAKKNYCVHYARSSATSIANANSSTWSYAGVLYSKTDDGYNITCAGHNYKSVGGHANLFKTIDGQLYMVLHLHQNDSDGSGTGGWREPAIIALKEVVTNGKTTLVWGRDKTNAIVHDISSDNCYSRLAEGSIGEASVSFSVNSDETARGGLLFTYVSGTNIKLLIGADGAVYVNGEEIGSVAAATAYNVVFRFKKDLSVFTLTINDEDLSSAAKSKFASGSLRTIGLYTEAVNGAKNGKAAYKNVEVTANTDGNAVTVPEFTDTKNASSLENAVTITGNGYSFLEGSGSAVYLKVKFNITNDHQGIAIYTDSINGNNAQICFQNNGYSLFSGYKWQDFAGVSENNGQIFSKNGILGIPTADKGVHTVEYFIIEGKLYIVYDGTNLFNKPLTLSELNSAFTADAIYHIGVYNYDGNATLDSVVEDVAFGDEAVAKYNENNK